MPLLESMLSHLNPVQIRRPFLFKIHFNVYYPSKYKSPSQLFHSEFPTKIVYELLTSPTRATCTANFTFLDFMIVIVYGDV